MKRPSEGTEDPAKRQRRAEDVQMEDARPLSLDQAFDALVERVPDRPAVEDDDGHSMSYRELQKASQRIAAGIACLCGGSDVPVVAVLLQRNCGWLAACLAVMRVGTLLALSCDLGGDDEERRNQEALREHRPRLLILERAGRPAPSAIDPSLQVAYVEDLLLTQEAFQERGGRQLDDALYLVYTGGTTAASKCVVQTHRMALHELQTYPDFEAMTCEDRILHHTSAFWGAACFGMFDLAWSCGACLVMLAKHGVNEVARAINERNITVAGIVPSLLDALDDKRCQSLRTVFTWGEPLRSSTVDFWKSRVQLLDLLIASEYWLVLYADHRKSGGFRPVPGAKLTLLQAEDAGTAGSSAHSSVVEVAAGEVGELYIAGDMVSAQGYTTAALNEGAFVQLPLGEAGAPLRHYRTRDLARVLADGTLEYCGRADGFAKVGGKWLDLSSVERKLQAAGCREASLLWDELTKTRHACVVPGQPGVKPLAAAALSWQALLPPQTRLHVLKDLPKNAATGKIARGVLLQELRKQEISSTSPRPVTALSRSLATGLSLARGLVRHGALVPLTFALAPGLSDLLWQGQYAEGEAETNGKRKNGSEEMPVDTGKVDTSPQGSNGAALVPLGVAERLSSWITWYRSIASFLSLGDLDTLPYLCLLLLDGPVTGLQGMAKVFQAPLGILGGALLLCRICPRWAKLLWRLAGQRAAERRGGSRGWSWAFWLGFPGFAESWSHHCWHAWPQGRVTGGGWQALNGIVKELKQSLRTEGERQECRPLLRCTYCWDWVPEADCTVWRHKTYCPECTEGWESYKQERCAELGVDTVSPDPTPTATPYSTPMGTPTATPRSASAQDGQSAPKKKGPSVVTVDFADYEVKLALRNVATTATPAATANGHTQNGQGSQVAQVFERATGFRAEDGQLAGLESLKVIILVSALRRELGVNLAAGDVIQCSSLSELEAMVEAAQNKESNGDGPRHIEETKKGYPIYAIPRFWKAPVGWLIHLHEVPEERAMRLACRALVRRHIALRAVPYRSLGDEATAGLCMGAVQTLLILRTLFGLEEVASTRHPLDEQAASGLWDAWPRVEFAPATGGWPMCEAGGPEESAHFEWLSFETEADLRHAAWLRARSRGFRTPATISVLFLPASAAGGKDLAYLQIAVNHAVTDAACIVPMVADLLELHRAAKSLPSGNGDLEAAALEVMEHCKLPAAPDGLAIAEDRLRSAVLGTRVPGWEERMDLLHNSCPPRKRGYDHYVKFTSSAGRVLEAASNVTGIPTDHLLVAALAAALSFAQEIPEVKLTLIVPMRDGPGHGQAVSNLASTRHLSVWAQDRSLFDLAFELSSRFRRRDWHTCHLLDDNGDRLFINLRGIPAFDGASPVIEPQDTTRKPTRFVRNIVEMFADQETVHSWTMWMGLREDVDAAAFSRALRKALWGLVTCPLSPLD